MSPIAPLLMCKVNGERSTSMATMAWKACALRREKPNLGESEVFDLPESRQDERPDLIKQWLDELCHLSDGVFDWDHWVCGAGVVQAGVINSQHQRGLVEGRTNVLRVGLEE
jgi:hypothetical protein